MKTEPDFQGPARRRWPVIATAIFAVFWLLANADWLWLGGLRSLLGLVTRLLNVLVGRSPLADPLFEPGAVASVIHWLLFVPAIAVVAAWCWWASRPEQFERVRMAGVLTGAYTVAWQFVVFATYQFGWQLVNTQLARAGTVGLFFVGLAWVVWGIERGSQYYEQRRPAAAGPDLGPDVKTLALLLLFFSPAIMLWARRRRYPVRRVALGVLPLGLLHLLAVPLWIDKLTGLSRFSVEWTDGSRFYPVAEYLDLLAGWFPLAVILVQLAVAPTWFAWRRERVRRRAGDLLLEVAPADRCGWWWADDDGTTFSWNPLDQNAWYYGRRARKLNQSISSLVGYTFTFATVFLLFGQIGGCSEIYELPAGGGEQQQIAQTVKVQKVIKRKYVVNPFSNILFKVPPIDDVKLQLTEVTHHAYTVGYGKGAGAGFAGGTQAGKVRFIRIEYSGGDWNQDFGVGADLNMLIEYGIRTRHKVHNKTESRTVGQLKNFPIGKSPPVVYLTGQKSISLSNNEVKILREYLTDKHGMIFGDNGGSGHFHNQFLQMMNRVLPSVRPVPVPLDDTIHRIPFQIPFLPYVAPHGGKVALGWKVDGRWVCYYHPGDIGDAWADGHAGVAPEIYEYCFQLGTNVIFYGHTEYAKWLEARKRNQ